MISFPPCKINLGLHVIAKRPDGYHDIETCFYPIPWTDILEIIPSHTFLFTSSGLAIPGNAEDNICIKAYQLLKKDFELGPVKIHLHKVLPTGAGLGGGSSDAAHTLRLLNQVFDLKIGSESLKQFAAQLGSDCSFFIENKPMLGSGRGEILNDIDVSLAGKFMVLVNPGIHVSTAEAYNGIAFGMHLKNVKEVVERGDMNEWKSDLKNDFEKTVLIKFPNINEVKESLYNNGASYAAMSGSGSTVFGIFDQPVDLKKYFPGMMYWNGLI